MRPHLYLSILLFAVSSVWESAWAKLNVGTIHIDTLELKQLYASSVIVDVRSIYEFEVMHIKGAVNIPVAQSNFRTNLKDVLGKDIHQSVVFYCNGLDCGKSERAGRIAKSNGFTSTYVYGLGIFDWAENFPELAVLFGTSPVRPEEIISDLHFNKYTLTPKDFMAEINRNPDAYIIDLRDTIQRKNQLRTEKKISNQPIGRLIKLLNLDRFRQHTIKKRFYIFDNVGKQIRWLQFYLERLGYPNYRFLSGGFTAYQRYIDLQGDEKKF